MQYRLIMSQSQISIQHKVRCSVAVLFRFSEDFEEEVVQIDQPT
jgi:hypothetical protein